jgi:hypothetical protein
LKEINDLIAQATKVSAPPHREFLRKWLVIIALDLGNIVYP